MLTWEQLRPCLHLLLKGGNAVKIRQMQMSSFLRDRKAELQKQENAVSLVLEELAKEYEFSSFSDQDFAVHLDRGGEDSQCSRIFGGGDAATRRADVIMREVVFPSVVRALDVLMRVKEKSAAPMHPFMSDLKKVAREFAQKGGADVAEALTATLNTLRREFDSVRTDMGNLHGRHGSLSTFRDEEVSTAPNDNDVDDFLRPAHQYLASLDAVKKFTIPKSRRSFSMDRPLGGYR